jgi:hypothetical protein
MRRVRQRPCNLGMFVMMMKFLRFPEFGVASAAEYAL